MKNKSTLPLKDPTASLVTAKGVLDTPRPRDVERVSEWMLRHPPEGPNHLTGIAGPMWAAPIRQPSLARKVASAEGTELKITDMTPEIFVCGKALIHEFLVMKGVYTKEEGLRAIFGINSVPAVTFSFMGASTINPVMVKSPEHQLVCNWYVHDIFLTVHVTLFQYT